MTKRTSYGFVDYEQGVEKPKTRPVKAPAVLPGEQDLFAPVVPAARATDPPTSNEGIHDLIPRAGSQQHKLLLAYASRPLGLTSEEAGEIAGLAVPGCCYWKRCSDLLRAGLLRDTFQERTASTGSAQRVLAISEHGYRAMSRIPKFRPTGRRAVGGDRNHRPPPRDGYDPAP